MISVLTVTYGRPSLLEECIQSFIFQNCLDCEMIIVNDDSRIKYQIDNNQIKIFNFNERFRNLSRKLEWGFKNCNNNYIYRLDDDDMLAPNALKMVKEQILNNPNYDIYRRKSHFYFKNQCFIDLKNNLNTGNVYTKNYINKISFPDKDNGEDRDITFNNNAKINTLDSTPTMIYRWDPSVSYHVSGYANISQEKLHSIIECGRESKEGLYQLKPRFKKNYYGEINK